nr:hypothetical protein [Tanacetum cinerariifolium]
MFLVGSNKRPYEISFQILFREEYKISEKMYHNLNQLQWQHKRENLHSCDPKTCFDVLSTQFKEFFDSKEVNASNLISAGKNTSKIIRDTNLKLTDEREIQQQESLITKGTTLEANLSTDGTTLGASSVIEGTTLEACLVTKGATLKACLVTKGATLEACLVTKDIKMDDNFVAKESTDDYVTSLEQLDESSSLGNDADVEKILFDTVDSDIKYVYIGPSYDSDTVSELHHDMFENMFAHGIQNHEQPKSISDT